MKSIRNLCGLVFLALLLVVCEQAAGQDRREREVSSILAPGGAAGMTEIPPFRKFAISGNGVCEYGEDAQNCPADCLWKVKSITPLIDNRVKDVDWNSATNEIAFARLMPTDNYYDVSVMNPDGSNERSLTDQHPILRKHNGSVAWHPSGKYIVFTGARNEVPRKYENYTVPGSGLGCDLWLVTEKAQSTWPLTNYAGLSPMRAVIHPHFSHDGKKLAWSERIKRGSVFGGSWVIKIGDFSWENGHPILKNITSLNPGNKDCFYETHGFSKDDTKIIFCGNLDKGQSSYGMDIYTYNLETGLLDNLRRTPNDWDEHAHYSPDGKRIAWMSSSQFDIDWSKVPRGQHFGFLASELWMANSDGLHAQRLTYFNDPDFGEFIGTKTIVSDNAWSPDGKSLVVLVAYGTKNGMRSKLLLIRVD